MRIFHFLVPAVLALAGCSSSVPVAPIDQDILAKQFIATADRANIYIVQDGGYGAHRIMADIRVDGIHIGALSGRTFLLTKVKPGTHVIYASTPENVDSVQIEVSGGQTHFIGANSGIGWSHMRIDLERLSDNDGRQAVLKARLAKGSLPVPVEQ